MILYSANRELEYRLVRRCSGGVGGGSRSLGLLGLSKLGLEVGTCLSVIQEDVNGRDLPNDKVLQ